MTQSALPAYTQLRVFAALPPFQVLEETGYDIEDKIKADHFVETTQGGKFIKLFIVPGLDPENQLFAPKCKFEIGAYAWHAIADLPSTPAEAKQVRKVLCLPCTGCLLAV